MNVDFEQKIALLQQQHEALLQRSNLPVEETNDIVWSVSVLTQP